MGGRNRFPPLVLRNGHTHTEHSRRRSAQPQHHPHYRPPCSLPALLALFPSLLSWSCTSFISLVIPPFPICASSYQKNRQMPSDPSAAAAGNASGASPTLFEPSKQEPMRPHRPTGSTPDYRQEMLRADTSSPKAAPTLQSVGS